MSEGHFRCADQHWGNQRVRIRPLKSWMLPVSGLLSEGRVLVTASPGIWGPRSLPVSSPASEHLVSKDKPLSCQEAICSTALQPALWGQWAGGGQGSACLGLRVQTAGFTDKALVKRVFSSSVGESP